MKYIVLYAIIFLGITLPEMKAQKSAIELLPATHELIHPEVVVDTSQAIDSLTKISFTDQKDPDEYPDLKREKTRKRENRKKVFSLDSLFRKQDSKKVRAADKSGNHPLFNKKYNPIRLFILITALKI